MKVLVSGLLYHIRRTSVYSDDEVVRRPSPAILSWNLKDLRPVADWIGNVPSAEIRMKVADSHHRHFWQCFCSRYQRSDHKRAPGIRTLWERRFSLPTLKTLKSQFSITTTTGGYCGLTVGVRNCPMWRNKAKFSFSKLPFERVVSMYFISVLLLVSH